VAATQLHKIQQVFNQNFWHAVASNRIDLTTDISIQLVNFPSKVFRPSVQFQECRRPVSFELVLFILEEIIF
jgi:hypothetical protein